jgi:hypothetical protein
VSITPAPPRFEVSTTDLQITAQAGAVLIRETARAVGLGEAIDRTNQGGRLSPSHSG